MTLGSHKASQLPICFLALRDVLKLRGISNGTIWANLSLIDELATSYDLVAVTFVLIHVAMTSHRMDPKKKQKQPNAEFVPGKRVTEDKDFLSCRSLGVCSIDPTPQIIAHFFIPPKGPICLDSLFDPLAPSA